jgi:hypothetical protein
VFSELGLLLAVALLSGMIRRHDPTIQTLVPDDLWQAIQPSSATATPLLASMTGRRWLGVLSWPPYCWRPSGLRWPCRRVNGSTAVVMRRSR